PTGQPVLCRLAVIRRRMGATICSRRRPDRRGLEPAAGGRDSRTHPTRNSRTSRHVCFGISQLGKRRDRDFGSAAPELVESPEGAHPCSRDGAWCSCVGGRSRGRNTSEPAVSLAPATARRSAVWIVTFQGPS